MSSIPDSATEYLRRSGRQRRPPERYEMGDKNPKKKTDTNPTDEKQLARIGVENDEKSRDDEIYNRQKEKRIVAASEHDSHSTTTHASRLSLEKAIEIATELQEEMLNVSKDFDKRMAEVAKRIEARLTMATKSNGSCKSNGTKNKGMTSGKAIELDQAQCDWKSSQRQSVSAWLEQTRQIMTNVNFEDPNVKSAPNISSLEIPKKKTEIECDKRNAFGRKIDEINFKNIDGDQDQANFAKSNEQRQKKVTISTPQKLDSRARTFTPWNEDIVNGDQNQSQHYPDRYADVNASQSRHPGYENDNLNHSVALMNQMTLRQAHNNLPKFNHKDPLQVGPWILYFRTTTIECGYDNDANWLRLTKERIFEGEAFDAVQGLLTSSMMVDAVIDRLENRFGRPEQILRILTKKARELPKQRIDRPEAYIKFITFADNIDNLVLTYENYGATSHVNNPDLLQDLEDKLEGGLLQRWLKRRNALKSRAGLSIINIRTFNDFLMQEANELRDSAYARAARAETEKRPYETAKHEEKSGRSGRVSGSFNVHVASKMSAKLKQKLQNVAKFTDEVPKVSTSVKCWVCEKDRHRASDCGKFLSMEIKDRWTVLGESKSFVCLCCLRAGHAARFCPNKKFCGIEGCKTRHNKLLHPDEPVRSRNVISKPSRIRPVSPSANAGSREKLEAVQASHLNSSNTDAEVLLKLIPVRLWHGEQCEDVIALLDDGASWSLMDEEIAQKLQLKGTRMPLCLRWNGETTRDEKESECVTLKISGIQPNARKHLLDHVRTVKKVDLPISYPDIDALSETYHHLKGVPIAKFQAEPPKLVIGCANWDISFPEKIKKGTRNEPVAMKTLLGWHICGRRRIFNVDPLKSEISKALLNVNVCECQREPNTELVDLIKNFVVESDLGVSNPKTIIESDQEYRGRMLLRETTKRVGNRFETGLLWKKDDVKLPNSYFMAKQRLQCTLRRIKSDKEYGKLYHAEIQKLVEKGWATKLTKESIEKQGPKTWYLPHFGVVNPNKPGKIRLVFDAAAKVGNTSLNSELLTGPDLNAALFDVLMQWRVGEIAFMGDVEAMFHQVQIREQDRDSQRFLFPDENGEIATYRMNVAIFGSTSSPTSAQYVKNLNALECINEFPEAEAIIRKQTYVDNVAASVDTPESAIQYIKEIREVFNRGGMNCRDFVSNSPEVMQTIGEAACDKARVSMNLNESVSERILGMVWEVKKDVLKFSVNFPRVDTEVLINQRVPTKRDVLRLMMSVFDPLGLLSHFMVYVKTLFQDIWNAGLGWNDLLPPRLFQRWLCWLEKLHQLKYIELPRCYSTKIRNANSIYLVVFCDASRDGFAAVAYFRIGDNEGYDVNIVAAKTKVAPRKKTMSIPRLELQAAVLASRLTVSILASTSLKVDKIICFTDAKNNILWLQSDQRKYSPFVAHRISEILENTELKVWRWIPTKENAADDATKWAGDVQFHTKNRFFVGPEFLKNNEENWPEDYKRAPTEESSEERKENLNVHIVTDKPLAIDFKRFSNWNRISRTMAYVGRMIDNKFKGSLQVEEIVKAEKRIFKLVQQESFGKELKILRENKVVQKSSSLYKLSPFLDEEGLIRLGGRIDNALNISSEIKRPIILPKDHHVTRLLIHQFHKKYLHQLNQTVVNEITQLYYIPDVRRVVKRVIMDCQMCKVKKAKPKFPQMGDLPTMRLAPFVRPFSYVGMDYFGPYQVVRGRGTEKRYGVIFTCMTTRAMHLEVAHTLNTDSTKMAISRFISRRGKPIQMNSDNGSNIKAAEKELREAIEKLNQNELTDECTSQGFKWIFNPPMAPHWGGAFERLIQSVKKALSETMPTLTPPSDELFVTLLVEAEKVLNCRPLYYMPVGPNEEEALTPNHFLLGSSNGSKPPGVFKDINLRSQYERSQQLTDIFWCRWVKEYLPTLRCRTKWYDRVEPLKVGDLVFFALETERGSWRRGKIVFVYPSRNNQVRKVAVETPRRSYVRPVTKIAPINVCQEGL